MTSQTAGLYSGEFLTSTFTNPHNNRLLYFYFFSCCHDFRVYELRKLLEGNPLTTENYPQVDGQEGIDVNCLSFEQGTTSPYFHRLVAEGIQTKVIRLLIEHGIDLTTIDTILLSRLLGTYFTQQQHYDMNSLDWYRLRLKQSNQEIMIDMILTICDIDVGYASRRIDILHGVDFITPLTPPIPVSHAVLTSFLNNWGSFASTLSLSLAWTDNDSSGCHRIDDVSLMFIDTIISCQLGSPCFQSSWLTVLLYKCLHRFTNRRIPISDELLTFAVHQGSMWAVNYSLEVAKESPDRDPQHVIDTALLACVSYPEIVTAASCRTSSLLMMKYLLHHYGENHNDDEVTMIVDRIREPCTGDSLLMYGCQCFCEKYRIHDDDRRSISSTMIIKHDLKLFRERIDFLINVCECDIHYSNGYKETMSAFDLLIQQVTLSLGTDCVRYTSYGRSGTGSGTAVSLPLPPSVLPLTKVIIQAVLVFLSVACPNINISMFLIHRNETFTGEEEWYGTVIMRIVTASFHPIYSAYYLPGYIGQRLIEEIDKTFWIEINSRDAGQRNTVLMYVVKALLSFVNEGSSLSSDIITWENAAAWLVFLVDHFNERIFSFDSNGLPTIESVRNSDGDSAKDLLVRLRDRLLQIANRPIGDDTISSWWSKVHMIDKIIARIATLHIASSGTTKRHRQLDGSDQRESDRRARTIHDLEETIVEEDLLH